MKKLTLVLASAACLLNSSCATILTKSKYPVEIQSVPNEAKIEITDKKGATVYTGYTPAIVTLKSSNGFFSAARYKIKFTKDGYETKEISINANLDGWYIGNILFGGFVGLLIVDPASGAMYKISNRNPYKNI